MSLPLADRFAVAATLNAGHSDVVALDREPVSPWTAWIMALRPKTLTLSLTPVAAGVFWAWFETGVLRGAEALFALLGALAIQIGTNLWNDACDGEKGADRSDRLGPPRVTALGILPAVVVRRAALAAFAAGAASGLVLLASGGWPIFLVGVVSLLCGLAYSSGPYPISASPFGELFVLLFFGLVAVGGTYYLQAGTVTPQVLLLGLVVGLPSAAVLLVNNHRDRGSDARSGRRTLAIVVGIGGSRVLYGALMAGAAVLALVLVAPACTAAWLGFLPISAVLLLLILDMARAPVASGLNRTLARTGLAQFAIFLTIAFAMLVCPA